jgi:hypothetical protein
MNCELMLTYDKKQSENETSRMLTKAKKYEIIHADTRYSTL